MLNFNIGNKIFVLGEIHCHDTSAAQSIPAGTGYTDLKHYTTVETAQNITAVANVGVSNKFTVLVPGWYRVTASSSSFISSPNIIFKFVLFKNETEIDQIHSESKFPPNDVRSGIIQGFVYCVAGDEITIRARHNSASAIDLIVTYSNFNMELIK